MDYATYVKNYSNPNYAEPYTYQTMYDTMYRKPYSIYTDYSRSSSTQSDPIATPVNVTMENTLPTDVEQVEETRLDTSILLQDIDNSITEISFEEENRAKMSNMNEILEIIKSSVASEKDDDAFFNMLYKQAPDEQSKMLIKSIMEDEKKHNQILRELYTALTGKRLPASTFSGKVNMNASYSQNLETLFFKKLDAISKKYRKILNAMPDIEKHNMMLEIITDELRHAHKLHFLMNKAMTK